MTYSEEAVKQLQADLTIGIVECTEEFGEDAPHDDIAFDLAVSMATLAKRADAEEFLRREFGYVPNEYKRMVSW